MSQLDDDLVSVNSYSMDYLAEADRAHLEDAGIPAIVQHVGLDLKLMVPRWELERAARIIGRHQRHLTIFSAEPEVEEMSNCLACNGAMPEGVERCPRCGWSYADGVETDESE